MILHRRSSYRSGWEQLMPVSGESYRDIYVYIWVVYLETRICVYTKTYVSELCRTCWLRTRRMYQRVESTYSAVFWTLVGIFMDQRDSDRAVWRPGLARRLFWYSGTGTNEVFLLLLQRREKLPAPGFYTSECKM